MIKKDKAELAVETSREMKRLKAVVDEALAQHLNHQPEDVPEVLRHAMSYAVLGGGKRLRPILTLAACQALGKQLERALPAGCALELIHAYSLVHDDLPSMDDDQERRGKPTVHVKFGVPAAILTGDALLSEAFQILSTPTRSLPAELRLKIVSEVARASGAAGMVGGQQYDMSAADDRPDLDGIARLHAMKTGALFRAAVVCGGLAGEANPTELEKLERYGRLVGRAFQVTDDLLDLQESRASEDAETTGDPHEDAVSLAVQLGEKGSRAEAKRLVSEACEIANSFGERGWLLEGLARLIESRQV